MFFLLKLASCCYSKLTVSKGLLLFTNSARTNLKFRQLDIIPRVNFSGVEYVNASVSHLYGYIQYNNMHDNTSHENVH